MERKKNKKFIFKIILCLVLIGVVIYIPFALKFPVTSQINYVHITKFSDKNKDDVSYVKDNKNAHQNFYEDEDNLSDNTNDYALVTYGCKVKSNCFSNISIIYSLVDNVPIDNNFFVSAHRAIGPRQTTLFLPTNTTCHVLVNRHGLTDEEIIEKIKTIELKVTYKRKGEAGEVEVKGIDSLKTSDIEWFTD